MIQNIDKLSRVWEGYEQELFKEIDRKIEDLGIDPKVHEKNIHNVKSEISDETCAACYRTEEKFADEYAETGMPESVLRKLFYKERDEWINSARKQLNLIKQISDNMNL